MARQKKVTKVERRSELEDQYAEMFKVLAVPLNWIPLPETVSLDQPSPYQVVPMISTDCVGE